MRSIYGPPTKLLANVLKGKTIARVQFDDIADWVAVHFTDGTSLEVQAELQGCTLRQPDQPNEVTL